MIDVALVEHVRSQFEAGDVAENVLIELYAAYHPNIQDVDLFIAAARSMFPSLNCGVASVYLQFLLKDGKVVRGRYLQYPHTFLFFEDGTIIDITADQYGGPRVYVGPLRKPWSL